MLARAPFTEVRLAASKRVCLTKGCGAQARARGLCERCYAAARRTVRRGDTSWRKLEARGMAAPERSTVEIRVPFTKRFLGTG